VRYCLSHPELLRVQLRAILRASSFGNVRVMFPLVTSLEEVERSRAMLVEIMQEFQKRGDQYSRDLPVGIMIEVPSAAVCADALARHCDFFSIGTNDLIQYTLAVDRANEQVASLYRPEHPAVLRLIKMTVDAANRRGIPVGLCGEMASVIIYTALLVGLGVDSLSVAPPQMLPEIKKLIRSLSYADAQKLAEGMLNAEGPGIGARRLEEINKELLPGLIE
jgi:phosphotransferase system enzyme I (PtsI)